MIKEVFFSKKKQKCFAIPFRLSAAFGAEKHASVDKINVFNDMNSIDFYKFANSSMALHTLGIERHIEKTPRKDTAIFRRGCRIG